MSILKKLASDTAQYGIVTIVGRFVYFLLVPLHTYIFNEPQQLADNSELFLYSGVATVLFVFGMETAFFRYGSKLESRQTYFNIALTCIVGFSSLLTLLLILYATPLINALNYPGKERLIVWMAMLVMIDSWTALPFARLRMEGKARRFMRIRLTNIGLNIFFNLFFIGFCRSVSMGHILPAAKPLVEVIYNPALGPDYIIWANFLANLYLLWALRDELLGFRFTLNWPIMTTMLIYGLPILLMGLAGTVNQATDRLLFRSLLPPNFYENLTSDGAFAVYANCFKLATLMNLVTQAFRYAAEPLFFSKAEDKNAPAVFADIMKWFIIVGSFLWVGISLQLDVLSLMLGKAYRVGIYVVPLLVLSYLLTGIYWNLSIWFKLSDRTAYGLRLTLVGLSVSVILSLLLIPRLGYLGSAITFTSSSAAMTLLSYYWGQKFYPIPYNLKSAGKYLGLASMLVLISHFLPIQSVLLADFLRFLMTLGFLALIIFTEFRGKLKLKM